MTNPFMRFYRKPSNKTAKAKSKSNSISRSFSPETKKKIASFTRKRNIKRLAREGQRLFKTIQNEIEVEDTICAICLGIMKHNDPITITITQCKHKFHSACLENWKKKSNSCPLCRKNISDTLAIDLDPSALVEQQRIRDEADTALTITIDAARQRGRDRAIESINAMRSDYVTALQALESIDNLHIAAEWRRVTTSASRAASIAAERARRQLWMVEAAADAAVDANDEVVPVAEMVASAEASQGYFIYQHYARVLLHDVREAATSEENIWMDMLNGGPRTMIRENAMRMADPYRWMRSARPPVFLAHSRHR